MTPDDPPTWGAWVAIEAGLPDCAIYRQLGYFLKFLAAKKSLRWLYSRRILGYFFIDLLSPWKIGRLEFELLFVKKIWQPCKEAGARTGAALSRCGVHLTSVCVWLWWTGADAADADAAGTCRHPNSHNETQSLYPSIVPHPAPASNSRLNRNRLRGTVFWSQSFDARYLDGHLRSARSFVCSLQLCKKGMYRAFNAVFRKVGQVASPDVVVQLVNYTRSSNWI